MSFKLSKRKQRQYEKLLIDAIKKYKWMRWAHIQWDVLSFSRATAYNYQLDKLDSIKECLEGNRVKAFNYLLHKWMVSGNPTLEIASMRIVSNDEDRQRLNQQYHEHNIKKPIIIVDSNELKDQIDSLEKED